MKFKYVATLLLLCGIGAPLLANQVYNAPLVNETGLAYNKTYPLNMANYGIDNISFQAIYTSATFKTGNFFDTSFSSGSANINIPSHGLTTAVEVLFSTKTNSAIRPLVNQTTYYVIPVDANNIQLATTSTGAVAGVPVIISTNAVAFSSYTLVVPAISGTPSFKFEVSNDGTNWTDFLKTAYGVALTTTTITTYVNPSTSTVVDVGPINYSQIRANVIAPTLGGLSLKIIPNAKNSK